MFNSAGTIDESTLIILLVPPPELHLLLGPVNTLNEALSKLWPPCEQWIQKLHIKRDEYHGGAFNGNDCRKLIKNVSVLEDIPPPEFHGFVDTFKSFDNVVKSCYGKELASNYKRTIYEFKTSYMKLGISVTPKAHAVFYHVSEFCDIKGMGLAPWSEQTAESLHSDFNKIWKNFMVRDTEHPDYGKRLLDAIIMYNSQHL